MMATSNKGTEDIMYVQLMTLNYATNLKTIAN